MRWSACLALLAILAFGAGAIIQDRVIITPAVNASAEGGRPDHVFPDSPRGVAVDSEGNLFFTVEGQDRVFKVGKSGRLTVFAGNGEKGFGGDGGSAENATLASPIGVAADSSGNVFLADTGNNRIRRVDARTGVIATVAGNGGIYTVDDVPAVNTGLFRPIGVAVDAMENLFITEPSAARVRRVEASTGIINTLAGNGAPGFANDGFFIAALPAFAGPFGVAADSAGSLFIADSGNHRICRLDIVARIVSIVAGNPLSGYSGDGGPAPSAGLSFPEGVALDVAGDLFIADTGNNCVRRVDATSGTITTVAGTCRPRPRNEGGRATRVDLKGPSAVAVDRNGNIFIADTGNNRICRLEGATGVMSILAGPFLPNGR